MLPFRAFLAVLIAVLYAYTFMVGSAHGWNLLPVFFADIARMAWPGQFNLDFTFMLMLSALWVAWRHGFSGAGLALAFVASVGGTGFLAPYLLVLTFQTGGDMRALLLGPERARAAR
ncbi:MAG: hypothetical protein K2Y51_06115 [Gammaproteobacteria bacterium]|nr:hypothetical protein [Gammaproteobacteria bacterium]